MNKIFKYEKQKQSTNYKHTYIAYIYKHTFIHNICMQILRGRVLMNPLGRHMGLG